MGDIFKCFKELRLVFKIIKLSLKVVSLVFKVNKSPSKVVSLVFAVVVGVIPTFAKSVVHTVSEFTLANDFYTENKKLVHVHAFASNVIDSWRKLPNLTATLSKDLIYVRENAADVYIQLQGIDAQALKLRHQAFYHYMLIEMSVVMASVEKNTSYLVLADKHVEKLFNVINNNDKSVRDLKYFLESKFANRILHYHLNADILRYLHDGKNENSKLTVERSLESYGGCNQLLTDGVYLDYVYEVTECSRAN